MLNQSDALSILRQLATNVSYENQTIESIETDVVCDTFPMPEEGSLAVPTGEMTVTIKLKSPKLIENYEKQRKEWAAAHPNLVPQYVNSKGK